MVFAEFDVYEKRCAESKRILEKYPARVPVIAKHSPHSDQPETKKKFLVSRKMIWKDFRNLIAKHMEHPHKTAKLCVNSIDMKSGHTLEKVYSLHKSSDGFLYVSVEGFANMPENLGTIKVEPKAMDQIAAVVKEKIDNDRDNTKLVTAVGEIENRVAALELNEKKNVVQANQLVHRISVVETAIMEYNVAAEGKCQVTNKLDFAEDSSNDKIVELEEEQCLETLATAVGQPSVSSGVGERGTLPIYAPQVETDLNICLLEEFQFEPEAVEQPSASCEAGAHVQVDLRCGLAVEIQPEPEAVQQPTGAEPVVDSADRSQSEQDIDILALLEEIQPEPEAAQQPNVSCGTGVEQVLDSACRWQQPQSDLDLQVREVEVHKELCSGVSENVSQKPPTQHYTRLTAVLLLLIFAFLTKYWEFKNGPDTAARVVEPLVSAVTKLESSLQQEKWKSQNLTEVVKQQFMTIQELTNTAELSKQMGSETYSWVIKEVIYLVIVVISLASFWFPILPKLLKERLSLYAINFQGRMSSLTFAVTDERSEQEIARFIIIQCPGVLHEHVEGLLFSNGITIKINKPAECGLAPLNWTQTFQFPWEEGLFDFKADEAKLENGVLSLVFRASASSTQQRVFKFPPHFSMTKSDAIADWDFDESDELVPLYSHTMQSAMTQSGMDAMACSAKSAPACLQPAGKTSGAGLEQMSDVDKAKTSVSGIGAGVADSKAEPLKGQSPSEYKGSEEGGDQSWENVSLSHVIA